MTTLAEILWAVDGPSYVTLVTGGSEPAALVERVRALRGSTYRANAIVLSASLAEGGLILVNGVYVDLGERTADFLDLLDEAAETGVLGSSYYSDPDAS